MTDSAEDDGHEESPRRFEVELFVIHPTMALAKIAAALGIEAQIAHAVGEARRICAETSANPEQR